MTHTYFFPEPGTISGIPGTFAGVQVEVDEESNQITRVSPLTRHPHFQASQEPDEQASGPEQEASPPEQEEAEQPPTEAGHASLASEPVQSEQGTGEVPTEQPAQPPEQPAQTEAPTNVEPPAEEAGDHRESEGV